MAIPDEKIEEIRVAADIVDVVSDYVRLKKSGSGYKGLCPFHEEDTPSFHVEPDQNLFYCFGCSKGGDVFTFLQEMEGMSFVESARLLADQAGIPLPEDASDAEQASEVEAIYHALRFAGRFFYRQLTQTNRGQRALDYLHDRGFTNATIKQFGLGYAPDAWDALLTAAEDEQIDPEVLEQAGLVIERNDGSGYYDRYRNRIIFPIFSHVGKVLGFGGRILNDDADQPKYINSPDTRVYDKSKALYGLRQAKQAIRKEEEALVVEGYTDVIALHQAGIEHAVASSGTALTEAQVKKLGRYADRLLLLYDADEAGDRAAGRAIDLVLQQELGAYVVTLPEGEDPDSYVQARGADAFREYLDDEQLDMPAFKLEQAERAGLLDTPEGQAKTMHAVVESIAQIPDTLMQETYLRRASEVLGVPDIRLYEVLEKQRTETQRKRANRARRDERRQAQEAEARETEDREPDEEPAAEDTPALPLPEERILLRLMLEHRTPMVEFILGNMALDEFTGGPPRELVSALMHMYREKGEVNPERIMSGAQGDTLQNLAAAVMMDKHQPSEHWAQRQRIPVPRLNDRPYEAAASAMTLLKLDRVEEAIDEHRQKIYRATQSGGEEKVRTLQNQLMSLHDLRKRIQRREFLEWNE